ncbi:MAG TPA: hypothetical protein VFG91_06770 [Woeseiaceae bacterium]|nr:hypothetical protein [Woeseiaceae bacterium]
MPFNLLLLPLLGGYLFITRFYGTAYKCSGYSGYRLILSASVVGLFFLLLAASLLRLLEKASDPIFLHQALIPPTVVGLLLVMFGSWRIRRVTRKSGERFDTDRMGEYKKREKSRRLKQRTATGLLALSILGLWLVAVHSIWGMGLLKIRSFWISGAVAITTTILAVESIKAHSELRGYEVAFRLGVIVAAVSVAFISSLLWKDNVSAVWGAVVPIENAGVSMLSFLFGALLWLSANYLFPYEAAVSRLVENGEVNGLEELFHHASVTFQQVMVSLSDEKVYIGYVDDEIPIKGRTDDFVKIIPTASGYRDSTDKTLVITTLYADAFDAAIEKGAHLSVEELAKVLPIEQIRSAGIFDPYFYEAFVSDANEAVPAE